MENEEGKKEIMRLPNEERIDHVLIDDFEGKKVKVRTYKTNRTDAK